MPNIAILGSTGSIGTQTLEVIRSLGGEYRIFGLSAGCNIDLLQQQIFEYCPQLAVLSSQACATQLAGNVSIPILAGVDGLCELATHPEVDIVVVSVVGSAGLIPTLAALRAGKRVLLANKETLVVGGHLVMEYKSQLIPIDSEHNAIWQCLEGTSPDEVASLVLTASGGPFRQTNDSLAKVTVSEALNHPSWKMGGKITIDSATLMNKGLEVIEAHWLFDMPYDKIEVIVHPQSIIHSLVRFVDGSLLAQMATTDMRLPIQYALTYPRMCPSMVKPLRLEELGQLSFEAPRWDRFPCLGLAFQAGRIGGTMPLVLNAANEVAVEAFLRGNLGFMDIPRLVEKALEKHTVQPNPSLDLIWSLDQEIRAEVEGWVSQIRGRMVSV